MVEMRTKSYWVPTEVAGERIFWMFLECNLNVRDKDGSPSIAERVWVSGNPAEGLRVLPPGVPEDARSSARKLLRPWPDGRYTPAYRRSGGLLNLFTPSWGEQEDEVWAAMVDEWKRQNFPSAEARQKAFQALEQAWNHEPHPFFARLTPAQVMVGGGEREFDLAEEFLGELTGQFKKSRFESEGEALIHTLTFLRGWEHMPREDGQTPREIIIAERDALLERRERKLQQRERSTQEG